MCPNGWLCQLVSLVTCHQHNIPYELCHNISNQYLNIARLWPPWPRQSTPPSPTWWPASGLTGTPWWRLTSWSAATSWPAPPGLGPAGAWSPPPLCLNWSVSFTENLLVKLLTISKESPSPWSWPRVTNERCDDNTEIMLMMGREGSFSDHSWLGSELTLTTDIMIRADQSLICS